MKFQVIIPARYASSRFPGKPLAMIGSKTMIERVYTQAAQATDNVLVATDDPRILQAVEAFGGRAVITSPTHRSGTDRLRQAYTDTHSDADVIINVQGDEPFVDPGQIRALADLFTLHTDTQIATLVRPFDPSKGIEALTDPNTPKVVLDTHATHALWFSRSVIPYVRGLQPGQWPGATQYYTHVGMYAYRAQVLEEITQLPPSPAETAESLEQLRWLQNGYRIRTAITTTPTIGIDTPADLEQALKLIND